MMQDDMALVKEFASSHSEAAFAALTERHAGLVYSAALRQTGDPHLAGEITQAVFILLARKAGSLGLRTVLAAWLCQATRYAAADTLKIQRRRQAREQEAYMQSTLNPPADADAGADAWSQLSPLLDGALAELGETDRAALVLRYFENKSTREIAGTLRLGEAAAQKRVVRALGKLRASFAKRGVTLAATVIAGAMAANAVQAAPVGMASQVANMAVIGGVISTTTTTLVKGIMKTMTWLKWKFALNVVAGVLLVGGAATVMVFGMDAGNGSVAAEPIATELIEPGTCVGIVQAGMSTDPLRLLLGRPDRKQYPYQRLDYSRLGLSILSNIHGVNAVICGDESGTNDALVLACHARTEEGIGMGATRAEVLQAYGPPASGDWTDRDHGQESLAYPPLGLTFLFQDGKVRWIRVDFPAVADGEVGATFYVKNRMPFEAFTDKIRRLTNAKPAESDVHALQRCFKLEGVELSSPPHLVLDEQNGLVKIMTTTPQLSHLKTAMATLLAKP